MVGGYVGDIEALHDNWWGSEPQHFAEVREILGGHHGGRNAATAGELTGGGEGFAEVVENVAERCGFFEIESFGCDLHLIFDFIEDGFFAFSFENEASFLYFLQIFFGGNPADAWCGAVADDVGVAVAVIGFAGIQWAADAKAESAVEPVQGVVESCGVRKGSEIARAVFFFRADAGEAGKRIAHSDPDMEEAFVIAESDVVAGPVVFDQLAFQ